MTGSAPHPNDAQTVREAIKDLDIGVIIGRSRIRDEALAALARLAAYTERAEALEAALGWYANEGAYEKWPLDHRAVMEDRGERARKALSGEERRTVA